MPLYNSYPVRESLFVRSRPTPYIFGRVFFGQSGLSRASIKLDMLIKNLGTNSVSFKIQSANRTDKALKTTDAWGDNGSFEDILGESYTVVAGGEVDTHLLLEQRNMIQFVTTSTDDTATTLWIQGMASADPTFILVTEPDLYRETFVGTTGLDVVSASITMVNVNVPSSSNYWNSFNP